MITGTLIVAYSAQVMVLIAAAAIALKVTRLQHARMRLMFYQFLLAVCVLLPWLETWMPREEASGLVTVTISSWNSVLGSAHGGAHGNAGLWVVWLIAVGAIVRFAWIGCGLLRLRHFRNRAVLIEDTRLSRVRIYISENLQGPATYGVFRPVILMPPHLEEHAAVLQHELIHIERRDWVWHLAEEFILCLLWFHPAVWWLKSEIELAREQTVDERTVSLVGDAGVYMRTLVEVAARQIGQEPLLASEFLGKSSLKSRVEMLVDRRLESRRKLMWSSAAIIGCLVISAWTAARALPLPWYDDGSTDHAPPQSDRHDTEGGNQAETGKSPSQIRVGGAVQEKNLVKKVTPVYPKAAKEAHIQGKVMLDVTISKEGRVTSVEPISGPPELIQSAVDAVKQWEYRPTLLNGNPVEVKSEVMVHYTLTK